MFPVNGGKNGFTKKKAISFQDQTASFASCLDRSDYFNLFGMW